MVKVCNNSKDIFFKMCWNLNQSASCVPHGVRDRRPSGRLCTSGCVRQTTKRRVVYLRVCETDDQAADCVPQGVRTDDQGADCVPQGV